MSTDAGIRRGTFLLKSVNSGCALGRWNTVECVFYDYFFTLEGAP